MAKVGQQEKSKMFKMLPCSPAQRLQLLKLFYSLDHHHSLEGQKSRLIKIDFINHYMLKLLLLTTLVVLSMQQFCASSCRCSGFGSDNCTSCLRASKRVFNSSTQECDCYEGFIEAQPPFTYCRPNNCTTYASAGCHTCAEHWQRTKNVSTGYLILICVCMPNYYYVNGTCKCLSWNQPTMYYESLEKDYCKICPPQCRCNQTGCYSCDVNARRSILNEGGKYLCECTFPYAQINGECGIYSGCKIVTVGGGSSLSCNASSLRYQASEYEWLCNYPYTDVNGVCTCVAPFKMAFSIRNSNLSTCSCPSKLYPATYYELNGACIKCPLYCVCSETGCLGCSYPTRGVIGGTCPCVFPLQYLNETDTCYCVRPYDWDSSSKCVCMTTFDTIGYHYDPLTDKCIFCPPGCSCNSSGCYTCSSYALRVMTTTTYKGNPYFICTACHPTAIYKDWKCICPPYSQFDNATGACVCYTSASVYVNLADARRCLSCPFNCTCSQSEGCFDCGSLANRQIIDNQGYKVCPCRTVYSEIKGSCSCPPPYQTNATNSYNCECMDPFESVNGVCQCKSINNPSSYYLDPLRGCFQCPAGCSCDASGCYECLPDTLRFIAQYQVKSCPCLQAASLINGSCTYCPPNYMAANGGCVYCESCATCNILGCLSCNDDALLSGDKCLCKNTAFENIKGKCTCSYGKYFVNETCKTCPVNCQTCFFSVTRNNVTCTSCKSGVNRMNAVMHNCPCQSGFKELTPIGQICCPYNCKTCNLAGCLTCSDTFQRQLVDNDCVCKPGFIDKGKGLCECPSRSTSYGGVCIKCPVSCDQCTYNTSSKNVTCTSCRKNVNRDKTYWWCPCLSSYTEALPQQAYCVSLYCQAYDALGNCTKCFAPRIISNDTSPICICKAQEYTVAAGSCGLCSSAMEGCLTCQNISFCKVCDTAKGYLLESAYSESYCRKPFNTSEFICSQNWQGVVLQVRLPRTSASFTIARSVTVLLYTPINFADFIYSSPQWQYPDNATKLNVSSFRKIGKDILQVVIAYPNLHYQNRLVKLNYTMINYTQTPRRMLENVYGVDPTGPYFGVSQFLVINQPFILEKSELNFRTDWSNVSVAVGLIVLVGFVLYVLGFKHNQLSFFLQTLAMIAYSLDRSTFPFPGFLYPMKSAFYQFPDKPSLAIIPDGYLEDPQGNFSYLSIDSNLFRVADITLLVALITAVLILLLRIGYYIGQIPQLRRVQCLSKLTQKTKKSVYRFLEFLYKTCMYPLLFFAVVNLQNWNVEIIMNPSNFRQITLGVSIGIITVYFLVTLWQWLSETIAKVNRIENVSEFLTAMLSAIIIAFTIGSDLFLLANIIFVARAVVYIFSRKYILRDFFKYDYLKAVTTLLEAITICLIKSNSIGTVAFFGVVTICVQISHEVLILILTAKKARIDKIKKQTVSSEIADSSIFNFMESRTEIGGDSPEKKQVKEASDVSKGKDKKEQRQEMSMVQFE